MRALPLCVTLLLAVAGCPQRKQPERGVELVFTKSGDVRSVVERRLARLGLVTRITEDESRLTVRVPNGASDAELAAIAPVLTAPGKLEFCPEAEPVDGALCGVDAGVQVEREPSPRRDCYLTAAEPAALLQAVGDAGVGRVLTGRAVFEQPLRTFRAGDTCLAPRVMEAEAKRDRDTNAVVLAMTFDGPSAAQFGRLTGALVRRRLLVVLDGQVQSAPVVMEAITGGRATLTFGPGATESEVARLGHALAGGPLPAPLTLERTSPYGPPSLTR